MKESSTAWRSSGSISGTAPPLQQHPREARTGARIWRPHIWQRHAQSPCFAWRHCSRASSPPRRAAFPGAGVWPGSCGSRRGCGLPARGGARSRFDRGKDEWIWRFAGPDTVDAGDQGIERAEGLIEVDTDVLILDTAHGHSKNVIDTVKKIKKKSNYTQIIAGNIATKEGAKALIDVGADAIKVGMGPGSICTTRMVAGVGVPQLSAILEVSEITKKSNIPLIADGGIKYSGDIAKAIAAGADTIMIGSLLAGTDESPGEVYLYQGRSYKSYRGMGSISAMLKGSAERYFQDINIDIQKLIPEGVEGQVPYKGPVSIVLNQLIGGLRSSMGYTGNENIKKMKTNCEFIKITSSGLKESHVHDVTITKESPNYKPEGTN